MISRLAYVSCDRCGGYPAQPGADAAEARGIARTEGYTRVNGQDICGRCSGTIDQHGWPVTHSDPYCATHCSPGHKHSQCSCVRDHAVEGYHAPRYR